MIAIKRRDRLGDYATILVYDADEEEMWGYPEVWESSLDMVGLSEEKFAAFFGPPYMRAVEVSEDPFEDVPNAEDLCRNYPPGSEEIPDYDTPPAPATYKDQQAEKAASQAADAALEKLGGDGPGNLNTAADAGSAAITKDDYAGVDTIMLDMQKRLVWWDGNDLSKAPAAWPSDDEVPKFVQEVIEDVIGRGVVWEDFEGYSQQAARAIRNSFEENLTQPQGWSISSLVDDLLDMYSGLGKERALTIARTEASAIMNASREEAYKRRSDSDDYVYYWQGPSDHRTTDVCKEIKQQVDKRGGHVRLEELKTILQRKAKKYENTGQGGTPERVDEWVPHYQCRHTFIRDVRHLF